MPLIGELPTTGARRCKQQHNLSIQVFEKYAHDRTLAAASEQKLSTAVRSQLVIQLSKLNRRTKCARHQCPSRFNWSPACWAKVMDKPLSPNAGRGVSSLTIAAFKRMVSLSEPDEVQNLLNGAEHALGIRGYTALISDCGGFFLPNSPYTVTYIATDYSFQPDAATTVFNVSLSEQQ